MSQPGEKSLIKKLGITKDSKLALISPHLKEGRVSFEGRLGLAATPNGLEKLGGEKLDIILVWVDTRENLADLLSGLKNHIKANRAIWAIIKKKSALAKGETQKVNEMDIINSAKAAGLVDNKTATISETEYAFRLVIPVTSRSGA